MRDTRGRRLVMRMLLGSNDLDRLEAVAKRLVASGIPIAVCKPSQVSPSVEVWIQRDCDFALAGRLLAEGVAAAAAMQAPPKEVFLGSRPRRRVSGRGEPRMLLASRDLLALEPVAKQLVASGIPIAVWKAPGCWSYVEIWIQRDGDCWAGPRLVVRGVGPGAATRAPVNRPCSGRARGSRSSRKRVSFVTARFGFSVWWRCEPREGEGTEGG